MVIRLMIKENVKQLSYRVKPDRFIHQNTDNIHVNNITNLRKRAWT